MKWVQGYTYERYTRTAHVGAALALLIQDAIFWVGDKKQKQDHHKEAFNDLCFCGEPTRHLCAALSYVPVWLSWKFRRYIRDYITQPQDL